MRKPRKSLVKQIAERRQQKATIAVDKNADPYLHAEAQRRGWRLLNLWHCGGNVPPEIQCQGALLTSLPDSGLVQKLLGKGCRVVRICFMIAQSGLDVPTDVAVLGRGNNVDICKGAMTPISSFENLEKHQIHAACDLLENWLNGQRPPEVPVIYEPFAYREADTSLNANPGGTGLSGNWTAASGWQKSTPVTYGSLETSGDSSLINANGWQSAEIGVASSPAYNALFADGGSKQARPERIPRQFRAECQA